MKFKESLRNLRKKINKKTVVVAAVLVLGIVGGSAVGVKYTSAARGDCDGNAVMYCGAYDKGTLKSKYNSNSSVRSIYAAAPFRISNAKFQSSLSGLQNGEVHRNGEVKIGSKVVATNAVTAGRHYIPGSTKMSGVNAYSRKPSVSYAKGVWALQAFVKFDANGRFEFAIIKSCGNPVTATPTQPPAKPGMKVVKSVKKAGTKDEFKQDITVSPGQKVEYVVGVTNTGNIPLTNVKVRDTLPNHVKYVGYTTKVVRSYGATSNISSITTGTRNIGTMPVGGTAFIFFQATAPTVKDPIKVCDAGKTRLRNVAFVKPDQTPEKNDDAYIQTCKPAKPDFTIVKSVKKAGTKDEFAQEIDVKPGQKVEYVVGIKNTGNVPLTNMWVRDELPKNVRYVGYTTKLVRSYAAEKKISNIVGNGVGIGTMPVGGVAFIFFEATAPKTTDSNVKECKDGKTRLRNIAFAKPDKLARKDDDAYIKTCKTTPAVKTPGVSIVKTVDNVKKKEVAVGQVFTYQLTIKNTGDVDLKDASVRDAAPAGVELLSADKGTIAADKQNLHYVIPSLKVGESIKINIKAKVTAYKAGELVNTACVNAKEVNPSEPNKADDCDTATVTVTPPVTPKVPAISIDKKVNGKERDEVAVGETFTYTLVVKNTGEVDLKNAVVTDKAPAGVEFLSTDKGSVAGNKLAYTIPSLKIGKSETITIKAKATVYKQGDIVNTACVNTPEVNPGQPEKEDDCDDATVTVEEPAKPVYECTTLNAQSLGELKYRFTPVINMSGSVTVNQVSYDFNDGTEAVVQKNANPIEHTYVAADVDKTYTVTATVAFNVGEEVKSVDCVAQVKISPIPDVEPPVVPPVEPPAPEAPTPQPPVSIIPATGIGSAVSGLAGTIAASYGGYALLEARRKRA